MRKSVWFLTLAMILGLCVCIRYGSEKRVVIRETSLAVNPKILDKVLICGVCRNVEKAIPNTIRSVGLLGSCFADYRVIIYENNSTDSTKKLMHDWEQVDPHLIFLSEQISNRNLSTQLAMKIPNRTEKIARARNIVLDIAMKKEFDDYKYVFWADLDFLEPWDVDSIVETVLHPEQEWDAVLAYGAYDLFALRSDEFPIGFELVGEDYWKNLESIRKAFVLHVNDPWKKVYSAFGGMGIYKRKAIRGCRYSGVVTKDLEKVAAHWLHLARKRGDAPMLRVYEDLMLKTPIVQLAGPLYKKRFNYPDEIGVCLPKGKLIWFSCSKNVTLPYTCEHIPFHASMALHGHDRIFINPKIHCVQ